MSQTAVGSRGEGTCQRLWDRILPGCRRRECFTDSWEAYAKVLPADRHCACGKGVRQTNHVTPTKP